LPFVKAFVFAFGLRFFFGVGIGAGQETAVKAVSCSFARLNANIPIS
tara:strand:+ start:439 stop:579 length:141 start_codon:yes stop_codon:yes gene_type:complete